MLDRIVEDLLNRVVSMDGRAVERLRPLAGRMVSLEFRHTSLPALSLKFDPAFISVTRRHPDDPEPDLTISGTPTAFARAQLAGALDDPARFDIQVMGDSDVGQRFIALFKELDIDWEDEIAKRLGDVPARSISVFARLATSWAGEARQNLGQNIGEFLREESGEVPRREDVDKFLDDVDAIRNRTDALGARIDELSRVK